MANKAPGSTVSASTEIGWVATNDALERLAAALKGASMAAIDTEFVREKTYYPQLCLIQIATRDVVACIDCLAPLDLRPLLDELFRPDFTWVLHSARQDLEVVWQRTHRMPPRLIDTQIAAALLGDAPQIGLEALLARTLGVELGESYARTDWSRRPLPEAALHYAFEDVRYLLAAWERLEARLVELGRRAWVEEDSERLLAERPEADTTSIWARIKGVHGLALPSQAAALALVRWREAAAQRADRPRRWLLADEVLLAIAAALPGDPEALRALVTDKFVARNGTAVLAAVASRADPEIQSIVSAHAAAAVPDKAVVNGLKELVRQKAVALDIEPELLATRRDLAALAIGRPPPHFASGWRAAILADALPGATSDRRPL